MDTASHFPILGFLATLLLGSLIGRWTLMRRLRRAGVVQGGCAHRARSSCRRPAARDGDSAPTDVTPKSE